MQDQFYNKTVTVWNKCVDGIWERETWIPTVIENARLLVSQGNNIQNSGNSAADSARLHISDEISAPGKPYLPPSEWNKLEQDKKVSFFTLDDKNDSFFVEGDVSAVDVKENFFSFMKENYPNCFKISNVDRFEIIPHFEVWGK